MGLETRVRYPQDSECAKSVSTHRVSRSDTVEEPDKSNIQGVGLRTFYEKK